MSLCKRVFILRRKKNNEQKSDFVIFYPHPYSFWIYARDLLISIDYFAKNIIRTHVTRIEELEFFYDTFCRQLPWFLTTTDLDEWTEILRIFLNIRMEVSGFEIGLIVRFCYIIILSLKRNGNDYIYSCPHHTILKNERIILFDALKNLVDF